MYLDLKIRLIFIFLLFLNCQSRSSDKNLNEPASTQKTNSNPKITIIDTASFHREIEGQKVEIFTLTNKNGLKAMITNAGARLVSLMAPDQYGNFDDIVLGFSTLEGYLNAKAPYYGAIIGRNANRINQGKLTIANKPYQLTQNNGENHLHGGAQGFHFKIWNVTNFDKNKISLSLRSPHLEEGYPGNVRVEVHYELTHQNELTIEYEATTDAPTIVNLSHHSFFNLKGEGHGTILNHFIQINANFYTPINQNGIPTGEIAPVKNTPFDFTISKKIGDNLFQNNLQLHRAQGFDHNFVLNDLKSKSTEQKLIVAANVFEPISGRTLEVLTNQPGLQFYTANFLNGSDVGKSRKPYVIHSGFCLETQHFPDAPNQPNFPSTVLLPNQKYHYTCVYRIGVVKP